MPWKARKRLGDTPLLETGELRDFISYLVTREGLETVGYVGSDDPRAPFHEYGTSRIPPRPFLLAAVVQKEHAIHAMAACLVWCDASRRTAFP
jgi:phage gpG-like protein